LFFNIGCSSFEFIIRRRNDDGNNDERVSVLLNQQSSLRSRLCMTFDKLRTIPGTVFAICRELDGIVAPGHAHLYLTTIEPSFLVTICKARMMRGQCNHASPRRMHNTIRNVIVLMATDTCLPMSWEKTGRGLVQNTRIVFNLKVVDDWIAMSSDLIF